MATRKKTAIAVEPEIVSVSHHGPPPLGQLVRNAIKSPEAVEKEELDPVTAAEVADKQTDTGLKKVYAYHILGILAVQLVSLNVIFILVGTGTLKYNDVGYLKMFMSGTLAEVFGVVLVITRYLFSRNSLSSNLQGKLFLPKSKRD